MGLMEPTSNEARSIIKSPLLDHNGVDDKFPLSPFDVPQDVLHLPVEPTDSRVADRVPFALKLLLAVAAIFATVNFIISVLWGHHIGAFTSGAVLIHAVAVVYFEVCLLTPFYGKVSWGLVMLYVMLLTGIHTRNASSAPNIDVFPFRCLSAGCTRVTLENPQRGNGLSPVAAFVSINNIRAQYTRFYSLESQTYQIFEGFIDSHEPNATTLKKHLSHSRALSRVFGFADDLFVQTTCDMRSGNLLIEAHSSQRMGWYDFGVNERRVQRLWKFLHSDGLRDLRTEQCFASFGNGTQVFLN